MIDEEIKLIIYDLIFQSKELLKYLKSLETGKYNAYLDDIIHYAEGFEEDLQNIKHYILELEIKLWNLKEEF